MPRFLVLAEAGTVYDFLETCPPASLAPDG
jgi:hypothetical protein